MKTLGDRELYREFSQIQQEVPYFLKYMKDIVIQVLIGKLSLDNLNQASLYLYDEAKEESEKRDELYRSGALGRLAIIEEPNEIQYFEAEKQRCLQILQGLGFE